jgi:transposase-like protein
MGRKINRQVSGAKMPNVGIIDNIDNIDNVIANNTAVVKCPHCGGEHVVKNGSKYNKQRYLCGDCKKSFCTHDRRIKRDIKERELCLLLYSHNMSLRSIQSVLCKFYNPIYPLT